MTIDIDTAAELISAHPDLSADVRGDEIKVSMYGRPAGSVTQDDLDQLSHTPTGWGKHLRKGALVVYRALTEGRS